MSFDLLDRAIHTATRLHEGQFRKGREKIPYITHPIAVALMLSQNREPEEVVAAGLLHDTIEDSAYTFIEMEREFGADITDIVRHVTHVHSEERSIPYLQRYGDYLDNIRQGGKKAWSVALADKCHNLLSGIESMTVEGPDFWKSFRGGMQVRIDFTDMLIRAAQEDVPDHPLFKYYLQLRDEWQKLIPEKYK